MNLLVLDSLEDVQSRIDDRGVAIDAVGITDLRVPLRVVGRDGAVQSTVASAEMTVSLPPEVKGTHMSRFVDVLTDSTEPLSPAGLVPMTEQIRRRLQSARASVSLRFPYFLRREAPVTGSAAPVDYEARVTASVGDAVRLLVGVRTPVTSLCPCSKEISDYGAHSQRGHVEITVACDPVASVWLEDLIDVAEEAGSAPVYSLLKRVDEREVTMQAYENPAFVEDIARSTAVALREDPRVRSFEVRVTNLESIHSHNAVAAVRGGRA